MNATETARRIAAHLATTVYVTPKVRALLADAVDRGIVVLDADGRMVRSTDRRAAVRATPDRRTA